MAHFTRRFRGPGLRTFFLSLFGLVVLASTWMPASAHAGSLTLLDNHYLRAHYNDEGDIDLAQYANRAYPHLTIDYAQTIGAYKTFQSILERPAWNHQSWQLVGPSTAYVPSTATYTGRPTTTSGRLTAIAVSARCNQDECPVWIGTAGGGVWFTREGLASHPTWLTASKGIASNAIGSIVIDPTDTTGQTLYVGTGEPNGLLDDEAGVGLYKSTNSGHSWQLIAGSVPAAFNRAIGAIGIDPTNSKHIYIGTDIAAHGFSSTRGGLTIPRGATLGLYESTDGGAAFHLAFSQPTDGFFRGGVTKAVFDRTGLTAEQPTRVYFSMYGYGIYRGTGNNTFERIFTSAGIAGQQENLFARTELALAPNGSKLRIYAGDTSGLLDKAGNFLTDFYRVDNANVPAAALTNGTTNPGWLKLSNPTKGTPGYASYNFCSGQCFYDMVVASPPGHPEMVWLGGQMQYAEIFTAHPSSNGRAIQRSTDAGVSFTDMTRDIQSPPEGMHPDQHTIAFAPGNPNIAFIGSDGGFVRTSGAFAVASLDCVRRGLLGADLVDCLLWLRAIPTRIYSLNDGLSTLQFQSLTYNPQSPRNDLIGGTQDNGTWAYNAQGTPPWFESVGGDGGQSVIDAGKSNIRMHTYIGKGMDVNFNGTDPLGWDFVSQPLEASGEASATYVPLIGDPQVSQTMFVGLQHVWRTQDSGGSQASLDKHCNELTGDGNATCGDWIPLGPSLVDNTGGTEKAGGYVGTISRAPGDTSTLWVSTRFGRLFISKNANAAAASVTFTRIDTAAQPTRFISGIAVDPKDANHAFVSFSGYNAYTPTTPGHVFEVTYDPATGKATWKDISYDLGDLPIMSIAYDNVTGDLYIATDFGVTALRSHTRDWDSAAPGLPVVSVYQLTLSSSGRVLYAATHGRSAWRLDLAKD